MANENNAQAEKKEKKPSRVAKYLKDLKSECKKIVWPSRQETVKKTSVVLVCDRRRRRDRRDGFCFQ